MNQNPFQKFYPFLGGIAGGVIVVILLYAPTAHANIVGDFFRNLFKPNFNFNIPGKQEKQPSPQEPAPLYKPVEDYERAVVAAVKKASPAVVSITVSKNVPIIENCP